MNSEPPATSLHQRVLATWQRAFPELTDPLDEPGTSILPDPQTPPTAWVSLWPIGERVVTRVAPAVAEQLQAVLDGLPAGHRMTADDLATCWPDQPTERAPQRLHALDPASFRPASPAPGQQVRALTEADRDDFEQFLGQCSPHDREEGDVDIGGEHELTMGVEAGDRIVAVASMFQWRGFSDLGVLTAPRHRRQGTARAVVSALCERLLDGPRVVVYRYSLDNLGSAGVARSLALTPLGVAESVQPAERPWVPGRLNATSAVPGPVLRRRPQPARPTCRAASRSAAMSARAHSPAPVGTSDGAAWSIRPTSQVRTVNS